MASWLTEAKEPSLLNNQYTVGVEKFVMDSDIPQEN